jgi:hypothetical protein
MYGRIDYSTPVDAMAAGVKERQDLLGTQQANALRKMQMQNAESEITRRNALLPYEALEASNKAQNEKATLEKTQKDAAVAELNQHIDHVAYVNDQPAWDQWRDSVVAKNPNFAAYIPEVFSPANKNAALATATTIREQLNKPLHFADTGGAVQGVNQYTGAPVGDPLAKSLSPGDAARNTETERHNRAQEGLTASGQALTASNKTAEKPLTALQQQNLRRAKAEDVDKYNSANSTANELETIADKLLGNPGKKIKPHPGLGGITGLAGALPDMYGGDARAARQQLETFKGKVKSLGRQLASVHGKLGNMAVQEWKMVSDAVEAIDPSAPNFDKQLRDVVRQARELSDRTQSRYEATYDEKLPSQQNAEARAMSGEDRQALDWANANPNDKRAAAIKQRLGM